MRIAEEKERISFIARHGTVDEKLAIVEDLGGWAQPGAYGRRWAAHELMSLCSDEAVEVRKGAIVALSRFERMEAETMVDMLQTISAHLGEIDPECRLAAKGAMNAIAERLVDRRMCLECVPRLLALARTFPWEENEWAVPVWYTMRRAVFSTAEGEADRKTVMEGPGDEYEQLWQRLRNVVRDVESGSETNRDWTDPYVCIETDDVYLKIVGIVERMTGALLGRPVDEAMVADELRPWISSDSEKVRMAAIFILTKMSSEGLVADIHFSSLFSSIKEQPRNVRMLMIMATLEVPVGWSLGLGIEEDLLADEDRDIRRMAARLALIREAPDEIVLDQHLKALRTGIDSGPDAELVTAALYGLGRYGQTPRRGIGRFVHLLCEAMSLVDENSAAEETRRESRKSGCLPMLAARRYGAFGAPGCQEMIDPEGIGALANEKSQQLLRQLIRDRSYGRYAAALSLLPALAGVMTADLAKALVHAAANAREDVALEALKTIRAGIRTQPELYELAEVDYLSQLNRGEIWRAVSLGALANVPGDATTAISRVDDFWRLLDVENGTGLCHHVVNKAREYDGTSSWILEEIVGEGTNEKVIEHVVHRLQERCGRNDGILALRILEKMARIEKPWVTALRRGFRPMLEYPEFPGEEMLQTYCDWHILASGDDGDDLLSLIGPDVRTDRIVIPTLIACAERGELRLKRLGSAGFEKERIAFLREVLNLIRCAGEPLDRPLIMKRETTGVNLTKEYVDAVVSVLRDHTIQLTYAEMKALVSGEIRVNSFPFLCRLLAMGEGKTLDLSYENGSNLELSAMIIVRRALIASGPCDTTSTWERECVNRMADVFANSMKAKVDDDRKTVRMQAIQLSIEAVNILDTRCQDVMKTE
jgi:hypothetical protein